MKWLWHPAWKGSTATADCRGSAPPRPFSLIRRFNSERRRSALTRPSAAGGQLCSDIGRSAPLVVRSVVDLMRSSERVLESGSSGRPISNHSGLSFLAGKSSASHAEASAPRQARPTLPPADAPWPATTGAGDIRKLRSSRCTARSRMRESTDFLVVNNANARFYCHPIHPGSDAIPYRGLS